MKHCDSIRQISASGSGRARLAWSVLLMGVAVSLGLGLGACQTTDADKAVNGEPRRSEPRESPSTPATTPTREQTREVMGTPARTTSAGQTTAQQPPTTNAASALNADKWVVVLAAVRGEESSADAALEFAHTRAGLVDAYITKRGNTTVVALGAFTDYADPGAKTLLENARSAAVDGGQPFAGAFLAPPTVQSTPGSLPELDLRNARVNFGENAQYTLQVCIYGRMDKQTPSASELAEFRKAAEAAAMELRKGGELSFYYHGPERSTVTVGLFTKKDLGDDNQKKDESNELLDARARHPHALINGAGVRSVASTPDGKRRSGDLRPSFLVEVPK